VLALQRRHEIRTTLRPLLEALLTAFLTFAVLAAWPIAVQFLGPQQVHGVLHNVDMFSTDPLNLVVPTPFQLIAPDFTTLISIHFSGNGAEANAYVGFLLLVLLAAFTARAGPHSRPHGGGRGRGRICALARPAPGTSGSIDRVAAAAVAAHPAAVGRRRTGEPDRGFMWLAIAVLITTAIGAALSSRRLRHAALRLGAIALALAAVLPAPLPASGVAIPVFFQNWHHEGIPDVTTVLVAPFVDDGTEAVPVLWAAVAGARFRMPAAYAAVPNADGTTAFGTAPNALSLWMKAIQAGGVTIVARGTVREQIGQDLRAARVSDMVVGPMTPRLRWWRSSPICSAGRQTSWMASSCGVMWTAPVGRELANSGSTALVDPDADDGSDAPVAACMPQTRLGTQEP
jgi:hypothetical protein